MEQRSFGSIWVMVGILGAANLAVFGFSLLFPAEDGITLEEYLSTANFLILQSLMVVVLLGSTLIVFRRLGIGFESIGLTFRNSGRLVPLAVVLGILLLLFDFYADEFLSQYLGRSDIQQALADAASDMSGLVVLVPLAVVLAPIAEEIYFRGYAYNLIKEKAGVNAGIIISGLYFGVAHLDPISFPLLSILGMMLAYIYEKTRSLLVVIIVHFIINSGSILLAFLNFI